MMDPSTVIGSGGSGKRELVLIGGGVLALGALFLLWRNRSGAASSVAADTGAAGYTYPMPGGALNTAPADNSTLTSLFTQQQEMLRLLAPSTTDVGSTTGTPDAGKPAPSPTVGDVPRFDPDLQHWTGVPMQGVPDPAGQSPDGSYVVPASTGPVGSQVFQIPSVDPTNPNPVNITAPAGYGVDDRGLLYKIGSAA